MRSDTVFLQKEQIYQTVSLYFFGMLKIISNSLGGVVVSLFNIPLFSKTYTKYYTIKFFGIIIYRKDLRPKLVKRILSKTNKSYDDIFLIRYNLGETVVFLSHLKQMLKFYGSKKPLFIVFRKKDIPFYSMFLLPHKVDFKFVELSGREIYEIYDLKDKPYKIKGQRFIAPIEKISEQIMFDFKNGKTSNFYDFIINSIGAKRIDPMFLPSIPKKAVKKIQQINLTNVIILCPEATSVQELPTQFWQSLAKELNNKGYTVFVNAFKEKNKIKNTKTAKLKLDELYALSEKAAGIITMANGIAIMMHNSKKMDIIYTPYHDNWFGYNATNTLKAYSIKHIPDLRGDIEEYDTSKYTMQQLIKAILNRY